MELAFTKMHGAGNDFVILDARPAPLPITPGWAASIADRRRGIGCDQIVLLEDAPGFDLGLRFLNADGTAAGACGNGTRCAASLVMNGRDRLSIRTEAGTLAAERADGAIRVDMGAPGLGWEHVPLARAMDTLRLPLPGEPAACSMGNPHATLFTADLDAATHLGPVLERDPLFPERANIGFAHVLDPGRIRLRVWERGTGLTLACGSGACAALVNAYRLGLSARDADILADGGTLHVTWHEDGHVWLAGPVATSFHGTVTL